jgi:hypothetical protein
VRLCSAELPTDIPYAFVSTAVAERYLGHVGGGVRGKHDQHKYCDEKKFAFEKLAMLIENVNPKENVLARGT